MQSPLDADRLFLTEAIIEKTSCTEAVVQTRSVVSERITETHSPLDKVAEVKHP